MENRIRIVYANQGARPKVKKIIWSSQNQVNLEEAVGESVNKRRDGRETNGGNPQIDLNAVERDGWLQESFRKINRHSGNQNSDDNIGESEDQEQGRMGDPKMRQKKDVDYDNSRENRRPTQRIVSSEESDNGGENGNKQEIRKQTMGEQIGARTEKKNCGAAEEETTVQTPRIMRRRIVEQESGSEEENQTDNRGPEKTQRQQQEENKTEKGGGKRMEAEIETNKNK